MSSENHYLMAHSAQEHNLENSKDSPPLGVKIYSVYIVVVTAIALLIGLMVHPAAFLVVLLFGSIDLLAVCGLWNLREWGWYLAVILAVIGVCVGAATGDILGFFIRFILLIYFFTVKDHYL